MKCLNCNTTIDDGLTDCPVCGLEIIPSGQWIHIYTINNEINAELYKAALQEYGIPVNILSQYDSTRMLTVGSLAIIKIYVPVEFADEALDLIQHLDNDDNSDNDDNLDNDDN